MVELTSYDRVMAVLNGKKSSVDRLPCINSVSVSTIDFMKSYDAYWPAAHKDPVKMAKLGSAAHRLCGLDNVTVPFCMTVEAEALGAVINFHEDTIKWPSIKEFHVNEPSDLKFPNDVSTAGRVPVVIEAIKILKKEFEGKVPVNAYITPPFTSISSYLVDSVTFLKWLRVSPEKVHQFVKSANDFYAKIAKLYEEAGADIITLHEMGASTDNISPRHFDQFVKPYIVDLIKPLKAKTILNICGDANMIVDKMVGTGASAISVDERTKISGVRNAVDKIKPGYPVAGNCPSYTVIHLGTVEKIRDYVKQNIQDGVDIVAPGCDFWLETSVDHVKAFIDAAKEFGKLQ